MDKSITIILIIALVLHLSYLINLFQFRNFKRVFLVVGILAGCMFVYIIDKIGVTPNFSNTIPMSQIVTIFIALYCLVASVVGGVGSIMVIFDEKLPNIVNFILSLALVIGFSDLFLNSKYFTLNNPYLVIAFVYVMMFIPRVFAICVVRPLRDLSDSRERQKLNNISRKRDKIINSYNNQVGLLNLHHDMNNLWLYNDEAVSYYSSCLASANKIVEELTHGSSTDLANYLRSNSCMDSMRKVFTTLQEDIVNMNNSIKSLTVGIQGENLVNSVFRDIKYMTNLPNYTLRYNENLRVECDNIIVTDKGIFILEVKNYGSTGKYNINIDSTGLWESVYGVITYPLDSPVEQNSRHISAIKNMMHDNKLDIPVYGVIVIANNTVNISNQSSSAVVRVNQLLDYIESKSSNTKVNSETIDSIVNILNGYRVETVKHSFINYNTYIDEFSKYIKIIKLNEDYNLELGKQAS